jgi:hypothetical protein
MTVPLKKKGGFERFQNTLWFGSLILMRLGFLGSDVLGVSDRKVSFQALI